MAVQRLTSKVKADIQHERFRFLTPAGLVILFISITLIFVFIFQLQIHNNGKVLFGIHDVSTELYLQNFIKSHPDNPSSKITLASIYIERGKLHEAQILLSEVRRSGLGNFEKEYERTLYMLLEKKFLLSTYGSKEYLSMANNLISLDQEMYRDSPLTQEQHEKFVKRLIAVGRWEEAVSVIKQQCNTPSECVSSLERGAKTAISVGALQHGAYLYLEAARNTTDPSLRFVDTLNAAELFLKGNFPKDSLITLMPYQKECVNYEPCIALFDKTAKSLLANGRYHEASLAYVRASELTFDKQRRLQYVLSAALTLESGNMPREALDILLGDKALWDEAAALKAVSLARANQMPDVAATLMIEIMTAPGYR